MGSYWVASTDTLSLLPCFIPLKTSNIPSESQVSNILKMIWPPVGWKKTTGGLNHRHFHLSHVNNWDVLSVLVSILELPTLNWEHTQHKDPHICPSAPPNLPPCWPHLALRGHRLVWAAYDVQSGRKEWGRWGGGRAQGGGREACPCGSHPRSGGKGVRVSRGQTQ